MKFYEIWTETCISDQNFKDIFFLLVNSLRFFLQETFKLNLNISLIITYISISHR